MYVTQESFQNLVYLTLKYANSELVSVQIFHIFTNIGVQNPGHQAFKHAALLQYPAFAQYS